MLSLLRAIKFGIQDFYRNIWLSLVTVTILILALISINMLLVVEAISNAAINSIKEKIDVNLFLKNDAEEQDALALKSKLMNFDEVKDVVYLSKADALKSFKEDHASNQDLLEALKELGKNPLSPTLVIKLKDTENYSALISKIDSIENDIIESKNFDDHEIILSKINNITKRVSDAGLLMSLIFIVITFSLVFNSIRVAIYTHRREIGIMRLVGASGWFIRAPYVISSIFYALVGVSAVIILFYPFLNLLQPYLETFFLDYNLNIVHYFNENFIKFFGLQFIGLAFLNVIASLMAVGKYSKD